MNTIYVVQFQYGHGREIRPHSRPWETVLGGEFLCAHGGKGQPGRAPPAWAAGGLYRRVGDDDFARVAGSLPERGHRHRRLITDAGGPSGIALIMVGSQGDNAIAVAPGVNSNLQPHDVEILNNLLRPGDVILLQLEIPLDTVLRTAEIGFEKQACVLLDPAPAPPEGLPPAIYSKLHSILPNEHEVAALRPRASCRPKPCSNAVDMPCDGAEGAALACQPDLLLSSYPVHAVDSPPRAMPRGGYAVALAEGYKPRKRSAAVAAASVTKMERNLLPHPRRGQIPFPEEDLMNKPVPDPDGFGDS